MIADLLKPWRGQAIQDYAGKFTEGSKSVS